MSSYGEPNFIRMIGEKQQRVVLNFKIKCLLMCCSGAANGSNLQDSLFNPEL